MDENPTAREKVAALVTVLRYDPAVGAMVVSLSVLTALLKGIGLGFILLTSHCVKHGCALLKWVSDIAETVHATPDFDWGALFRRARDYGTARRLRVGLGVASSVLDVDVPGLSARLETDPVAADLVSEVHDRFVSQPLRAFQAIDTAEYHRSASESPRARLVSWVFVMPLHPTPAEYRLLPLPGSLHPVYYLLRPLRLFVTAGLARWADSGRL